MESTTKTSSPPPPLAATTVVENARRELEEVECQLAVLPTIQKTTTTTATVAKPLTNASSTTPSPSNRPLVPPKPRNVQKTNANATTTTPTTITTIATTTGTSPVHFLKKGSTAIAPKKPPRTTPNLIPIIKDSTKNNHNNNVTSPPTPPDNNNNNNKEDSEINKNKLCDNVPVTILPSKKTTRAPSPPKSQERRTKVITKPIVGKEEENISIEDPPSPDVIPLRIYKGPTNKQIAIIKPIKPQIPPKPILKTNNHQEQQHTISTESPTPPPPSSPVPPPVSVPDSPVVEEIIKPRQSRGIVRSKNVARSNSVPASARRIQNAKNEKFVNFNNKRNNNSNNNSKSRKYNKNCIVNNKNLQNQNTKPPNTGVVLVREWKKSQSFPLILLKDSSSQPSLLSSDISNSTGQHNNDDDDDDINKKIQFDDDGGSCNDDQSDLLLKPLIISPCQEESKEELISKSSSLDDPLPIAPPRHKRKSLSELTPPNTPVISFQPDPEDDEDDNKDNDHNNNNRNNSGTQLTRNTPIYTKGNRVNRKWPYRRNARKFSKNSANTEKTSLLIADDDNDDVKEAEKEIEQEGEKKGVILDLNSPVVLVAENITNNDKWNNDVKTSPKKTTIATSICSKTKSKYLNGDFMDGNKEPRHCLETVLEPSEEDREEEDEVERNKENASINQKQQSSNHGDLECESKKNNINNNYQKNKKGLAPSPPSLAQPPQPVVLVETETELCDKLCVNKSFLFTLIDSPIDNEIVCDDNGKCQVKSTKEEKVEKEDSSSSTSSSSATLVDHQQQHEQGDEQQQQQQNNNNNTNSNDNDNNNLEFKYYLEESNAIHDIPTVSISECESTEDDYDESNSSSKSKQVTEFSMAGEDTEEEENGGLKSDLGMNDEEDMVFEEVPLVSESSDYDGSLLSNSKNQNNSVANTALNTCEKGAKRENNSPLPPQSPDGEEEESTSMMKKMISTKDKNQNLISTHNNKNNSFIKSPNRSMPRTKSSSCLSSPKPKRKNSTSLLDLVDIEIQKVQSLLHDMTSASKRHSSSRKKSVNLTTEQPKAVLLRKSSVPELRASITEFQELKNDDEVKLVRHSWATKSTSSVGSTTSSSSSLGSNLSKSKSANVGPPVHARQRRKSDFTPLFWADEGDSSTGALGDIENSSIHSSNEDIRFLENSGRSTFRRRRTVADFLGKARKTSMASFANASMIWAAKKKHHSELLGNEVPKIQIIYADSSSSDGKDSKSVTFEEGDEDDNEYYELLEMKKKTELESYERIQAGLTPKGKKAFYVVREILTSEKTFVEVLHLITNDFPKSLRKTSQRLKVKHELISEPDLEYILGGLPILKGVNEDLLQDLEERVHVWTESSKIADIFVKKGAFLKHYTNYIKDFEKISKFFDHYCDKNAHFANAVRIFERSKRCHNLGLKPYMLKPVQRMPQYSLLLEDYLKNLEEDHEDYEDTIKAISIVKQVAEHANDAIKTQTAMERLIHLQDRLPNIDILGENKQLIREGELMKVCRKDLQMRHFALMNDSLLVMTYNNSSTAKDLKIKYKLPLTRMRVMVSPVQENQCEFSIIAIARSFNVIAKNTKDREDWVDALTTAIKEHAKTVPSNSPVVSVDTKGSKYREKLGKQAPVWIQDSRASMCQVCTESWGLVFRRHHCRACGKVVCRYCSSNEAPLEYLDFNTARVCDACYFVLLNECEELQAQNPEKFSQRRLKFKKFNLTKPDQRRSTKYRRTLKVLLPLKPQIKDGNTTPKLSGHLEWKEKKTWRRNWFVLIDCVLYIFAASEDTAAIKTLPVLGYTVGVGGCEDDEGQDEDLSFTLQHKGRGTILFQAESSTLQKQWIAALTEATNLVA